MGYNLRLCQNYIHRIDVELNNLFNMAIYICVFNLTKFEIVVGIRKFPPIEHHHTYNDIHELNTP
jgi:hypothetical protein